MVYQTTPLRFVPIGFGNTLCANRVLAVQVPLAAPNKRLLARARKENKYLDLTCGRGIKSLVLMAEGHLVGCYLKPAAVLRRLNAPDFEEFDSAEEEEADTV